MCPRSLFLFWPLICSCFELWVRATWPVDMDFVIWKHPDVLIWPQCPLPLTLLWSCFKYLPNHEPVQRGGAPTFASAKVKNAIGRIGIFYVNFQCDVYKTGTGLSCPALSFLRESNKPPDVTPRVFMVCLWRPHSRLLETVLPDLCNIHSSKGSNNS